MVKICDFGLSRETYVSNYYRAKKRRALPTKWMAMECLAEEDAKFGCHSDMV